MCEPVTIAAVGVLLGTMASKQQAAPSIPPPPAPEAPPQAAKSPDVQGVKADQAGRGQAGGAPGLAQTFLAGSGGVDPDLLKLGKSTLLGA